MKPEAVKRVNLLSKQNKANYKTLLAYQGTLGIWENTVQRALELVEQRHTTSDKIGANTRTEAQQAR